MEAWTLLSGQDLQGIMLSTLGDTRDTTAPVSVSRRSHKRSRLVCLPCHQKKIKCDIQHKPTAPCSKCVEAGAAAECRIRPSKRLKSAPWNVPRDANNDAGSSSLHPLNGLDVTAAAAPSTLHAPNPDLPLSLLSHAVDIHTGNQETHSFAPHPPLPPPLPGREETPSFSIAEATVVDDPIPSRSRSRQNTYSGPSPASSAQGGANVASYLGDSGYLQIFSEDGASGVVNHSSNTPQDAVQQHNELPPPALQESYLETYFRYCYTWCPILDRSASGIVPATNDSSLVQNAVALIGSHMEPPVMQHVQPVVYYERAKALFYRSQEKDPLLAISALMLFYWWGSSPPNIVSIDTAWWWTGVVIRQSQQLGLHREPRPGHVFAAGDSAGLRRRIWWTLFARERLTSICTGRPSMIDPDDCNVAELTLGDFPDPCNDRANIFIYWVRLCAIVGQVSKHLLRRTESTSFPAHLAYRLKQWTESLPPRLRLPIHSRRTTQFDPDVHQLHLTYLTTVTLLYLDGTSRSLPRAYTAAVLASCCVARIFEDYTARGSMRFLHGIAGWSITIAILALLHARKVPRLAWAADAHIHVLRVALKEMAKMWHSSLMFDRGFERIDTSNQADPLLSASTRNANDNHPAMKPAPGEQSPLSELSDHETSDGLEWRDFFPYLTPETSPLAAMLLAPLPVMQFVDLDWPVDLTLQLQGFFDPLGDLGDSQMLMLNE